MSVTEWKIRRVDEMGAVQAGRQRSPHFKKGELRPYLRVANVYDGFIDTSHLLRMRFSEEEFQTYRLEAGDILLNEGQSLGLVGRCAIYQGMPADCCFQNTLVRFRSHAHTNPHFAFHLFQYLQYTGRFAAIASQTTSIAHLGVSRFAALTVAWPELPEQERIAAVLSRWDRAINTARDLYRAKRRFKHSLVQELLTGKRRFGTFVQSKGIQDTSVGALPIDWKTARINNLFTQVRRKNENGHDRVLTVSGRQGLVNQREYFNRSVAGKSLAGYYLLRRGEFAYNRSTMKGHPYGAIKRLNRYEDGVLSTLYLCFALVSDEDQAYSDFYSHFFESGLLNRQLRHIAQAGARSHGLLNVSAKDFFNLVVPVPPPGEQRAIASVLSAADREIELLSELLATLKEQKRGLMQKLLTGAVRVPLGAGQADAGAET